jgi:hypothetical protein
MTKSPLRFDDKTLRPYREQNLTPLTLREELERYQAGMINWLVTQGWPSAREAGSLWQLADLSLVLLEWLELVEGDQAHQDLVERTETVLLEEIVPYLLDPAHVIRSESGRVTWDGHLHDTSEVVTVLVKMLDQLGERLSRQEELDILEACHSALDWIVEERMIASELSHHSDGTLAHSVGMWGGIIGLSEEQGFVTRKLRRGKFDKYRPEVRMSELIEELIRRARRTGQESRWYGHHEVLKTLAQTHNMIKDRRLAQAVIGFMPTAIKTIEEELWTNIYDVGSAKVAALDGYFRSSVFLSSSSINRKILLPSVYEFCWKIEVYPDRSIYHSLRVTTEFASCLNGLLGGSWAILDEPLLQIYQTALQQTSPDKYARDLRKEIFEGLSREQELRQRIDAHKRQINRYKTFFTLILTSIAVGGFALFLTGPSNLEYVGALTGVAALVIGFVPWIIDRWHQRTDRK